MARFIGGPCNGQTAPSPPQPFRDCGGATYALLEDGNYHAIGASTGGGAAFNSSAHQLDGAWRRLMRAYGVTMPRALRRSAAGRTRMKRVVR